MEEDNDKLPPKAQDLLAELCVVLNPTDDVHGQRVLAIVIAQAFPDKSVCVKFTLNPSVREAYPGAEKVAMRLIHTASGDVVKNYQTSDLPTTPVDKESIN